MITRLAHVCIVTPDLAATESFYTEALGLRKVFNFISKGEVIGFYLEVAEKRFIEVFRQAGVLPSETSPIRHLCLETDDIDALAQAIRAKGYEVTEKSLGADHSWQMWVTDPGGVQIEFHQYTEESSQLTGLDCVLG